MLLYQINFIIIVKYILIIVDLLYNLFYYNIKVRLNQTMAYKILLIDDSKTQMEMLKLRFVKAGFEVETAENGAEGYQKVFSAAPDIILSDIIMPNLNGYQFCRLLKNNPIAKDIPVILLTILDKKIDKFWGNRSGADRFISKTASFEQIEQITRELMEIKPISDEYKTILLENIITGDAVQNQINNVLDELLMHSTFLNEFRDLGEFLIYQKVLVEKTFALLGSFVDYNVAGLFFNGLDKNEKKVLNLDINKNHVSSFIIEKIKRDFFFAMPEMENLTIRDLAHDVVREKVDSDVRISSPDELITSHIVPIEFEGNLLGGVCFFSKEKINYTESKFYKTMIEELLLLFKMRFLYSETEYLSVSDGLTGLYNRRHFEYNLEREFLRAKRYKSSLSLAIVDIDFFKSVNDTYGHQFGDYVLKEIAILMPASFRKTDMIYRYGGEELAVILTETDLQNAFIPLDRLREKIAQHKFCYNGEETNVTISVGVSTNFFHLEHERDLVKSADEALYKAKQDGRNRVVVYSNEKFDTIIQQ